MFFSFHVLPLSLFCRLSLTRPSLDGRQILPPADANPSPPPLDALFPLAPFPLIFFFLLSHNLSQQPSRTIPVPQIPYCHHTCQHPQSPTRLHPTPHLRQQQYPRRSPEPQRPLAGCHHRILTPCHRPPASSPLCSNNRTTILKPHTPPSSASPPTINAYDASPPNPAPAASTPPPTVPLGLLNTDRGGATPRNRLLPFPPSFPPRHLHQFLAISLSPSSLPSPPPSKYRRHRQPRPLDIYHISTPANPSHCLRLLCTLCTLPVHTPSSLLIILTIKTLAHS